MAARSSATAAASAGRGRDLGGRVHHPEGGELGAPGHVEEAEPHAGVGARREPELGHRLVQLRLEVGVPVEAVEQLEGEAVLGDEGRVADGERRSRSGGSSSANRWWPRPIVSSASR